MTVARSQIQGDELAADAAARFCRRRAGLDACPIRAALISQALLADRALVIDDAA